MPDTANTLSGIANLIGLLALAAKTFYDLNANPRKFRRELKAGIGDLKAAERKRERGDCSTAWTFAALTVSYLLCLIAAFF